jgi:CRP-like cAMP-binding protein
MTVTRNGTALPLQLAIECEAISYTRGELIIEPLVENNYIYVMVMGIVKVYTRQRHEQSIHLLYGPGELFPISWIISKKQIDAYIEAMNDVVVHRYRKDDFLHAIQTDAAAAFSVVQKLTMQLNLYVARVDNLEFKYASQRLAYRLIFLAQRFGTTMNHEVTLPPLHNQELGSTLNLSRESVSRELARFERLGFIRKQGMSITITNQDGLHGEVSKDPAPLFVDDFDAVQETE